MRVLVTGCYGFLGASLCVRLLNEGHTVYGIDKVRQAVSEKTLRIKHLQTFPKFEHYDINLIDYEKTRQLLDLLEFDSVVHLAGQYSAGYTTGALHAFIDGNIRSWCNVMDAVSVRPGIRPRVLYASSTFVQPGYPLPKSMYGATLEFRERAAMVYAHMGMETVGMRFGGTYGPHMRPDTGPYIIGRKLLTGKAIDGAQGGFNHTSGMIYIDDAVEVMMRLLVVPLENTHNVFTLVANEPVRALGTVLKIMERTTGIAPVLSAPVREVAPGYTPTDRLKPLADLIGYMPSTPLEIGIPKFICWMQEMVAKGELNL